MADDRVPDQSKEQQRKERAILGQYGCSEKVRDGQIGNRGQGDRNDEGKHQVAELYLNEAACRAVFSRQQINTIAKTADKTDSEQRIERAVSDGSRSVRIW